VCAAFASIALLCNPADVAGCQQIEAMCQTNGQLTDKQGFAALQVLVGLNKRDADCFDIYVAL
jgi:hypothetical protein